MSNNEWFECGELPPVGTECEIKMPRIWKKCKIMGSAEEYGIPVVLVQVGKRAFLTSGTHHSFRPIKSEREKAIDEIKSIIVSQGWLSADGTVSGEIAAKIYDAGFRKTEV